MRVERGRDFAKRWWTSDGWIGQDEFDDYNYGMRGFGYIRICLGGLARVEWDHGKELYEYPFNLHYIGRSIRGGEFDGTKRYDLHIVKNIGKSLQIQHLYSNCIKIVIYNV